MKLLLCRYVARGYIERGSRYFAMRVCAEGRSRIFYATPQGNVRQLRPATQVSHTHTACGYTSGIAQWRKEMKRVSLCEGNAMIALASHRTDLDRICDCRYLDIAIRTLCGGPVRD